AWRSFSPNELMSCSTPGVADADGKGEGDAAFGEDGVGLWPNKLAATKIEMTVRAARFNIALIVSRSPRSEQYRADSDSPRTGWPRPLDTRAPGRSEDRIPGRSRRGRARPRSR